MAHCHRLILRRVAASAILATAVGSSCLANESAPVTTPHTVATLISDADRIGVDSPFHLALRLRIAPGWHTYWVNPGGAGLPPDIQLTLPPGSKVGPISWPAPRQVTADGITSYVYTGDVVLPVSVETPAAAGPVDIAAHAEWLVCKEVCIPESGDFRLTIGVGAPAPSAEAPLILSALQATPAALPKGSTLTPNGVLSVALPSGDVASANFFPLQAGAIGHRAVAIHTDPATGLTTFRMGRPEKPSQPLPGVLVVQDQSGAQHAYQIAPMPAPDRLALADIGWLLVFGFIGGMLLNCMPCVFPILAMKALALSRLSGRDARTIRADGLSYSAGVVLSFTALGGLFLLAQQTGLASGWGFQFRSPNFVLVMTWLLVAIGLNLSGVYSLGHRVAAATGAWSGRHGRLSSVLTGVLAVVVATPCTAPFMATAIAGAALLPPAAALAVFGSMGLGLAAPYGAISLIPGAGRLLPRPGAWMATVQRLLAFPMYGAAVWLLWVLSQQAGPTGVLRAGIGIVLLAFSGWAFEQSRAASAGVKRIGRTAALSGLAGLVALVAASASPAGQPWAEPFTNDRLASLRAEGRPVFVDVSAAWCLSCLVNERLALAPKTVRDAFAREGVTLLRGDWTKGDPAISAYLAENGRDGVPLYVFYPPGKPPTVLPELLSQSEVLNALAQLGS